MSKSRTTGALPNYIRSLRRKNSVSQTDLARLLGNAAGTSVLRHENHQRTPKLDTALGYAAIFGIDPRELYAGRYEGVLKTVQKNAGRMLKELERELAKGRPVPPAKLDLLHRIAETKDIYVVPCDDALGDDALGDYAIGEEESCGE